MSAKSMCWLLNAIFEYLGEVDISKPAVRSSLEAAKSPLSGRRAHHFVSLSLHDLFVHVNSKLINGLDIGKVSPQPIFHPIIICSTKSCMPMVKNGKFYRNDVAGTALNSLAGFLDFRSKVERPG